MDAPPFMKRHYLRFFYEKLLTQKKLIIDTVPTPIFLALQANHAVIIRKTQLPACDTKRTKGWVKQYKN